MILFLLTLQIPFTANGYRADMSRSAYRTWGPGAPVATLAAQIHQESGWRVDAKSWAGAEGLAQFMPATGRDMAQRHPELCAPANPYSPRWAFGCRDRYLKSLHDALRPMAGGLSECSRFAFALRAYNGGGQSADRRKAATLGLNPDDWQAVRNVNARRSAAAHRENKEYPEHIYRLAARYVAAGWGETVACP